MSYLVDALKKAEHERYAHQRHDMSAVSTSEASTTGRSGSRLLIGMVILLVASNLGLMIYLLRPVGETAAPGPTAKAGPSATPATQTQIASASPAGQAHSAAAKQRRPPVVARKAQSSGTPSSRGQAAASGGQRTTDRVRYGQAASSSVTRNASAPPPAHPDAAASQPALVAATPPKVTINGQLFSSVPGRSFILVNGRRYHEGERLAAGPAVQTIGRTGATLVYRGRRYHVPGPQ